MESGASLWKLLINTPFESKDSFEAMLLNNLWLISLVRIKNNILQAEHIDLLWTYLLISKKLGVISPEPCPGVSATAHH